MIPRPSKVPFSIVRDAPSDTFIYLLVCAVSPALVAEVEYLLPPRLRVTLAPVGITTSASTTTSSERVMFFTPLSRAAFTSSALSGSAAIRVQISRRLILISSASALYASSVRVLSPVKTSFPFSSTSTMVSYSPSTQTKL